jgi:hypothetical protein
MSAEAAPSRHAALAIARGAAIIVGVTVSAVLTFWLIGVAATTVSGNKMAPWIVGRASGIASYVLLMALVLLGLVLSHPWRARYTWPSTATRLRTHVSLAVFTLAFVVLHIVVLATDSYAGVGIKGALVPMGASYRPVPTTLGVIALYAGLLAGLTAAFAGRFAARVWWPIHKVSIVVLVLVWTHGVLAGSDTHTLLAMYLVTALAVVVVAVSRYSAKTPADQRAEYLASDPRPLAETPRRHR